MFAYVGSRTTRERHARGEGISVFRFDVDAGHLECTQVVNGLVNPSYLLHHPTLDVLYTVHGDQQSVSAFSVDRANGNLRLLQAQDCGGRNPVHLALAPGAGHLVISNHLSGTLAVLPVAGDGTLQPVAQIVLLEGRPGPHRVEQPFSKPHFNAFDPSGRCVLVPDKGLDRVFVFQFDDGELRPAATPCVESRDGAGPRHLAFHPSHPWVYVVNELDSTVTAYGFDGGTGALQPFQVLSTLADHHTGNSRAAGISVNSAGTALYASNRGADSIAVFSIDPASGRLQPLQDVPTGGRTPRFFTFDPSGRWLLVLNEDSDGIHRFAVDPGNGALSAGQQIATCGSPVCLVFEPARRADRVA